MAALGWQVGQPATAYIFASQILALISVCDPTYVYHGWHGALLTIGSATTSILVSVYVMHRLTIAQGLSVVVHCLGFLAFLIILWTLGPKADAFDTFFHFDDLNGWGSLGVAALVGIVGPVATNVGGDAAVHLAEELQDASYVLPRAMSTGSAVNYLISTIALITFMFNVGTIDDSLYRYGGQPWVAVVYRITGSKAATIVMLVVVIINVCALRFRQKSCLAHEMVSSSRSKSI